MRQRLKDLGWIIAGALLLSGFTTSSSLSVAPPSSTVANLPACSAANLGALYVVTDALVPVALATVGGTGAVKVLVMCNGTNYIVA